MDEVLDGVETVGRGIGVEEEPAGLGPSGQYIGALAVLQPVVAGTAVDRVRIAVAGQAVIAVAEDQVVAVSAVDPPV